MADLHERVEAMCEMIRKIKDEIRAAEKARQDLIVRIDALQAELSKRFIAALRQYPAQYEAGKRVDDVMLASSQRLDQLEMDYLRLENRLKLMQHQMLDLMQREKTLP